MYGKARRKREGAKFKHDTQFAVYNIHSGTECTFDDDGVSKVDNTANMQRRAAIRRLDLEDEYGDPIYVVKEIEPHTEEANRHAGPGYKIKSVSINSPSRHPDFSTLRAKFEANKALREAFLAEKRADREALSASQNPNPALATKNEPQRRARAKKADKEALGASKASAQ